MPFDIIHSDLWTSPVLSSSGHRYYLLFLVPHPPNINVIWSLWIFVHKEKPDGSFERHKARLVGDGKTQQVGVDCGETFSPIVKPATIRTVLNLALSKAWPIYQLNIKNTFLHGELKEIIYMYQPLGYWDLDRFDLVSPRAWYKRFASYVHTLGFSHSTSDHSLFIYHRGISLAYLLLYVDDIILTISLDELYQSIITLFSSEFAKTGPVELFPGHCNHSSYNKIIDRADMSSCKPSPTSVDTKPKLGATTSKHFEDPSLYRSLVGELQYLTFTRLDITYVVVLWMLVFIFIHLPCPLLFHILMLLRDGCPDTRRLISDYCIFLATLSHSSAEVEYRGVANVVFESCWLQNLLLELHCPIQKATLVYYDNVSSIYLVGNPVQHQRTKHIEMDIHFVQEKVARGQVRVLHVPLCYQIIDIFTKGFLLVLFEDFRDSLNIRRPPASTAGVHLVFLFIA
ncbi:hypothetical protein AAHE18_17G109800 [Arachis hypogaea]